MQRFAPMVSILVFSCVAPFSTVMAEETAEQKGTIVMQKVDNKFDGFGDFTADVSMTLRDKSGQSSSRLFRVNILEVREDGDKNMLVFQQPADIKGTALLTYSHLAADDDQWLFLPSLQRVKRISSSNKSGPFVGSEFAYEDLTSQEADKYRHVYLGEEKFNELDCYMVERTPKYEHSGYAKQKVWVDKKELRYQKIEYFDQNHTLLKTLTLSGYQLYENRYWRAATMLMVNQQNGRQTELAWDHIKYKNGLQSGDFTVQALKRFN